MKLYAESSAILAWLLGEPPGKEIRHLLRTAEHVFTSVLTFVEADRVLIRAQIVESLSLDAVAARRRTLIRASRHWHMVDVHREVLERARRPFPTEPIQTLDALHLASALAVRTAVPELALLSLDLAIRRAGAALALPILPT